MAALNGETTRQNEARNMVQATIKNFKQKETTEHNYQNFIVFSKNGKKRFFSLLEINHEQLKN